MAMYNIFLTDCLDKHAPWRYVRVRGNTPHPWYIDHAREKKRKLENLWRGTKLEIHRQLYVTAREECTALISARKTDYYQNRLEKANNKTMFRLLRSLDGQRIQQHSELYSTAQGCEIFSHFFSEKIDKLLSGLQCFNSIDRPTEKRCFTDCIHVFDPTTNAEITTICGTTDKTCVLDFLPANQLRDNTTSIVSVITLISNASLDEAVMPRPLKHVIVRLSLKKPSLDKDILNNYRPVSKLTQLSKVIEKVVALRIMTHVSD